MKTSQTASIPPALHGLNISHEYLCYFVTSSSSFEDTVLLENLDEIDALIQRKRFSFNSDLASPLSLDND